MHRTDSEEKLWHRHLSYQIADVNGTSFYNFKFNLPAFDPSLEDLPADSRTLDLYLVVNGYGDLIITTHPQPAAIYKNNGTGILDNAEIAAMFTGPATEVSAVSYMSIDNFWDWLKSVLTDFDASSDIITDLGTLFAPWHDIFSRDKAETTNIVHGSLVLHVDTEKFDDYPALFEKMAEAFESEYKAQFEEIQQLPLYPPIIFSDVILTPGTIPI